RRRAVHRMVVRTARPQSVTVRRGAPGPRDHRGRTVSVPSASRLSGPAHRHYRSGPGSAVLGRVAAYSDRDGRDPDPAYPHGRAAYGQRLGAALHRLHGENEAPHSIRLVVAAASAAAFIDRAFIPASASAPVSALCAWAT